jgi:hypothetical protein
MVGATCRSPSGRRRRRAARIFSWESSSCAARLPALFAPMEPPFEKILIWIVIRLSHKSEQPPLRGEGRLRRRARCEGGAAPAPAVFAHRGPGSPWRAASRPIMRPRVNVPYRSHHRRKPGQRTVGHQGFKTPQWSAVRRGRPIARLVACPSQRAGIPGAPCGALLPPMREPSKYRTKLARDFPPRERNSWRHAPARLAYPPPRPA